MKTSIEDINLTPKKISSAMVKKIISKTLKLSGIKPAHFSVSVAFLPKSEIKKLNRKYRKYDKSTDVLSFCYSSGYNKGKTEGELFLCPEIIEKSAQKNKVSFKKELAFVLSHGILHLLGFRHGKKMYQIQDEVCKILNPKS